MFPLIFCSLCAHKFWCVCVVLEMTYTYGLDKEEKSLHTELEWVLGPKLGEDPPPKKKVFTQKWSSFCVRKVYCNVQKCVCKTICLWAIHLCVCTVSETSVGAHSLEGTLLAVSSMIFRLPAYAILSAYNL